MDSKNVNLMAPFTETGYGVVGRNIMCSLHELGWDIKLYDIANATSFLSQKEARLYETFSNNGKFFYKDTPCVRIWHQHVLDVWAGNGEKIGWPIFELDIFNELEKHHLSFPDKIAVCSKWAQGIIKKEIGRDSYVVPLGVDSQVFHPATREHYDKTATPFVFLNVGKWEVRKGHDILPDIFNRAFRPDDNVRLRVLASEAWSTEQEREDWRHFYKDTKMGNYIHLLNGVPSQTEVALEMNAADAGIFPTRAEGWNLELLEMMACGKPVITTAYGAHLEFCNESNAHLIYPEDIEPAADGKFFHGQGNWARLDDKEIDEFAEKMRAVYENGVLFNKKGVETAKEFSWKNSVKTLTSIF